MLLTHKNCHKTHLYQAKLCIGMPVRQGTTKSSIHFMKLSCVRQCVSWLVSCHTYDCHV